MGRFLTTQAITVGTDPVKIAPTTGGASGSNRRRSLVVYNTGSVVVFIGDEDVTHGTGFPVAVAADQFNSKVDLGSLSGELWAVTESGTSTLRIMEVTT